MCRDYIHTRHSLILYLVRIFIIAVVVIHRFQILIIIVALLVFVDINLILFPCTPCRPLSRSREGNERLSLDEAGAPRLPGGRTLPRLSEYPPAEDPPGGHHRPPCDPPLEGVTLWPAARPYESSAEWRTSCLHFRNGNIILVIIYCLDPIHWIANSK